MLIMVSAAIVNSSPWRLCLDEAECLVLWVPANDLLAEALTARDSRSAMNDGKKALSGLAIIPQSLASKILEPRRCQLGVAHRVLNILMS